MGQLIGAYAMTDRTPMQRALDAEAKVTDLAKRVEVLEGALKPFSDFAGELFARNNMAQDPVAMLTPDDPHGKYHKVTAGDFFAARKALSTPFVGGSLARINALVVDALCDALPYVEDALTDEGFKPGAVQKVTESRGRNRRRPLRKGPHMSDLANQFMRSHFGLGSSTRGMTMDEHNKGRSEAEARAEHPFYRVEELRKKIAWWKNQKYAVERSDNFCFTNGRMREIDDNIKRLERELKEALPRDERRMFRENRDEFAMSAESAAARLEDAGMDEVAKAWRALVSDFIATTWNVDPRAEG